MKTAIRTAAFAIAAAAALAPAAAHACELQPPGHVHVKVHAEPAVVNAEWNGRADHDGRGPDWERGGRDGGPGWRDHGGRHHDWEHRRWVKHQRMELRAAYARLDEARAHFYARPHRRWEIRKFERWYARERAELDARWQVLVAWR
ncbi:MAG TPA: hypothetical protein VEB43_00410 [Anaeromyxobacter sp.]|nr:hypothetical protein [Anaeromyxobacter sp.]